MKRMTVLTMEMERVVSIRRQGVTRRAHCATCGEMAHLVTVDEAAALARVSARAIYRLIEAERIHLIEVGGEPLLICFNSICRSLAQADLESYARFK